MRKIAASGSEIEDNTLVIYDAPVRVRDAVSVTPRIAGGIRQKPAASSGSRVG